METETPLRPLSWGYKMQHPDGVLTAFGARLIDTSHERMTMLHDRKDYIKTDVKIDEAKFIQMLTKAKDFFESVIRPWDQTYDVYAFRREDKEHQLHYTAVASQNASHGYVYFTMWVTRNRVDLSDIVKLKEE
jgi:hypothetical protein